MTGTGDTDTQEAIPAGSGPNGARKPRRSHRIAVSLLLVLGTILTPITIVAIFVNTQITDTSRYVQNVTPLAKDPAIQAYVADDVTNRLFEQVDVAAYVRDSLPERAQRLAGPLQSALKGFVHEATLRILESDQFQKLWVGANRVAHAQLVTVLTGNKSGTIVAGPKGQVSIDLSALAAQVQQRLQDSGIDLFSKLPVNKIAGQIPLFQSEDLHKVRQATNALDKLAFVLPFVVLACFAGAVWLSRERRRGFLYAAIGFAIGAVALGLLLNLARTQYLNAATSSALPYDAAAAVYDTLVRFLHTSVRAAVFFSVILVIGVFFTGPSRAAIGFRRGARRSVNWLGDQSDSAGWGWLGANGFMIRNKGKIRIAIAVIAFLIAFRWTRPTAVVLFWIALVALAALVIVEFFGREPLPPPEPRAARRLEPATTPTPAAPAQS